MYEDGIPGAGDLGRRVAARRRELGLSREEVAARARMSVPYLTYLETYPANVTMSCLMRLTDALEMTPAALLGADSAAGRGPCPGMGQGAGHQRHAHRGGDGAPGLTRVISSEGGN